MSVIDRQTKNMVCLYLLAILAIFTRKILFLHENTPKFFQVSVFIYEKHYLKLFKIITQFKSNPCIAKMYIFMSLNDQD